MTHSITPVTRPVISGPDTQAAIWFLGALSQVRFSGGQSGGAFSLTDNLARRGNASPVHVHDRQDETFFVLDGELRVQAGEPAQALAMPPPPGAPPDLDALVTAAARHGITILAPPPQP